VKRARNFALWLIAEILVALIVHWFLAEKSRGFPSARTWWAKFTDQPFPASDPSKPLRSSADVCMSDPPPNPWLN